MKRSELKQIIREVIEESKKINFKRKLVKESFEDDDYDPEAEWEDLPEEIKEAIYQTFESDPDLEGTYEGAELAVAALEELGWTADFDLAGELYGYRPLQQESLKQESKFIKAENKATSTEWRKARANLEFYGFEIAGRFEVIDPEAPEHTVVASYDPATGIITSDGDVVEIMFED